MNSIMNNRSLITLLRHDLFLSKYFVETVNTIEECYKTFPRSKGQNYKNMTYSRTVIGWFEKYLSKLEDLREQELKQLIDILKVTLQSRQDESNFEKLVDKV